MFPLILLMEENPIPVDSASFSIIYKVSYIPGKYTPKI